MSPVSSAAASVRLHRMPFGAQLQPEKNTVRFRLWAPTASQVELALHGEFLPMQDEGDGWYALETDRAKAGDTYKFRIDGNLQVPDPASRYQDKDVHDASVVIDPAAFQWRDENWKGRPWEETVLYEMHVGTFTPEGTFKAAKEKLDYLVETGVTAVELMPLADFPGRHNWGYDGVLLYAPDSSYGTPDDLKDFIQTAHEKGLMVFLDVVYNHFGPEGNYLHAYAKRFFNESHHTPWGAAINYDAEGSRHVRDFVIHNAMYWLEEYHFDGLRFDAVHAIADDSQKHVLNELAERVREHIGRDRHIHLVLENDDNASRFLNPAIYNGQWNDDSHHAFHVVATGESSGYYSDYAKAETGRPALEFLARCLTEGFAYQGEASIFRDGEKRGEPSKDLPLTAFVNFIQNHDQIGNRAFGDRIASLTPPEKLRMVTAMLLLSPSIPLLYMGEEWGTKKPFQFFCDFGEELAPLVTEGRRKEFAKFPEFSNPETRERIPDPSAMTTLENSRLDWSELNQPEYAEVLELHRQLLQLRRKEIIPRLKNLQGNSASYTLHGDEAVLIQWTLGDGSRMACLANFGEDPVEIQAPAGMDFAALRLLFESAPGLLQNGIHGQHCTLPACSVAYLLDR